MMTASPIIADRRWGGVDGLYGGYVVALLVDAAVNASTYSLASLSVNFVSRVRGEPGAIDIERMHSGRSTELLRLALKQDGHARVYATAELIRVKDEETAATWIRTVAPQEPGDDAGGLGRHRCPFDDFIELRRVASPHRAATNSWWARLRPAVVNPGVSSAEAMLAVLLDAPTPGPFDEKKPDFVPSIDVCVHFAPRASWNPRDWVRLDHLTSWATPSYCSDEVTAWSTDGRLLGTVRQTRRMRFVSPSDGG